VDGGTGRELVAELRGRPVDRPAHREFVRWLAAIIRVIPAFAVSVVIADALGAWGTFAGFVVVLAVALVLTFLWLRLLALILSLPLFGETS
jgi:hypothetical protein